MNIIVPGLSKSEKREHGDMKEDGTQIVKKIFIELRVEAKIENVVRLGRVEENKHS